MKIFASSASRKLPATAMPFKCRRHSAKRNLMCESRNVQSPKALRVAVARGDRFSGASFRGVISKCSPRAITAGIARGQFQKACNVAPGVGLIIRQEGLNRECRQVVRAANEVSKTTGIIVPGVMAQALSRKVAGHILINATQAIVKVNVVAVR